jgi:hypothetical protein
MYPHNDVAPNLFLTSQRRANQTPSIHALRERYENPWNGWHTLRTRAALAAFLLAILALIFDKSNPAQ